MSPNLLERNMLAFMLAGNSRFTITDTNSKCVFNYYVKKKPPRNENDSKVFQVHLTVPGESFDNDVYFGYLKIDNENRLTFHHNSKYKIFKDNPCILMFLTAIKERSDLRWVGLHIEFANCCQRCGEVLWNRSGKRHFFCKECFKLIKPKLK